MTDDAPVRVLVTGSRTWVDAMLVWDVLAAYRRCVLGGRGLVVVHGAAQGVDRIADDWAERHLAEREVHPYFGEHGRAGGHIRNAHMVELGAAVCLAFIADGSRGATGCATLAARAGIPVWVWRTACPRSTSGRRCSARCRHAWGQEAMRGPEQLSLFPT